MSFESSSLVAQEVPTSSAYEDTEAQSGIFIQAWSLYLDSAPGDYLYLHCFDESDIASAPSSRRGVSVISFSECLVDIVEKVLDELSSLNSTVQMIGDLSASTSFDYLSSEFLLIAAHEIESALAFLRPAARQYQSVPLRVAFVVEGNRTIKVADEFRFATGKRFGELGYFAVFVAPGGRRSDTSSALHLALLSLASREFVRGLICIDVYDIALILNPRHYAYGEIHCATLPLESSDEIADIDIPALPAGFFAMVWSGYDFDLDTLEHICDDLSRNVNDDIDVKFGVILREAMPSGEANICVISQRQSLC